MLSCYDGLATRVISTSAIWQRSKAIALAQEAFAPALDRLRNVGVLLSLTDPGEEVVHVHE